MPRAIPAGASPGAASPGVVSPGAASPAASPMPHVGPRHRVGILLVLACCGVAAVSAQSPTDVVVPAAFAARPGNVMTSMPLRWSGGRMQTLLGDAVLAELRGRTIERVVIRRSLLDRGAWPTLDRTLELTLAMTPLQPARMTNNAAANLANATTVVQAAPAAVVTLAASPAPGRDDVVGADLLDLALATPFAVPAAPDTDSLLLDWVLTDPSGGFSAANTHWVDAVQFPSDTGYGTPIGFHGCGVGDEPMQLIPVGGATAPRSVGPLGFELRNAPASQPGFLAFVGGRSANFPQPVPVRDCVLWLPLGTPGVVSTTIRSDATGVASWSVTLPSGPSLAGIEIVVQAIMVGGPGPVASNAVSTTFDTIGVDASRAASIFIPWDGSTTNRDVSPYGVFAGVAPVVRFVVR